jgi:hypothetical protein
VRSSSRHRPEQDEPHEGGGGEGKAQGARPAEAADFLGLGDVKAREREGAGQTAGFLGVYV